VLKCRCFPLANVDGPLHPAWNKVVAKAPQRGSRNGIQVDRQIATEE
jgi:hypothetical protein